MAVKYKKTGDPYEVKSMDLACFPYDVPYPFDDVTWWVGYLREKPIAYCGIKDLGGAHYFLCRAGVTRSRRGEGHHRKMIRLRERHVKSRGGGTIITYVTSDNVHSANNLAACGYKMYVPEDQYGPVGAIYYAKQITPPSS